MSIGELIQIIKCTKYKSIFIVFESNNYNVRYKIDISLNINEIIEKYFINIEDSGISSDHFNILYASFLDCYV